LQDLLEPQVATLYQADAVLNGSLAEIFSKIVLSGNRGEALVILVVAFVILNCSVVLSIVLEL